MKRMHGATMAVSLLMLFVITLLGVSTIQTTQMQERMSANLQDKELSFLAAESALRTGEAWILAHATEPPISALCNPYPCVQSRNDNIFLEEQTQAWWAGRSAVYPGTLTNIATPPRYIIEYLQFVSDTAEIGGNTQGSAGVHFYRITARGTGATDEALSILQTTVARRF